jgi:stage II sporulation protein AA (anti-sigma F factor antagonist)
MSREPQPANVAVSIVERTDTAAVVAISGEIDIATVDDVREATDAVLADGDLREITFDLQDLDFVDSSGLALFLSVAEAVDTVTIRNPTRQVKSIIDITGLQEILPIEG